MKPMVRIRDTRHWQCGRKVKYHRFEAIRAAADLNAIPGNGKVHEYECQFCFWHHVGHVNLKEKLKGLANRGRIANYKKRKRRERRMRETNTAIAVVAVACLMLAGCNSIPGLDRLKLGGGVAFNPDTGRITGTINVPVDIPITQPAPAVPTPAPQMSVRSMTIEK